MGKHFHPGGRWSLQAAFSNKSTVIGYKVSLSSGRTFSSLTHAFSAVSENIAENHTLPKLLVCSLIYIYCRQCGSSINEGDIMALKVTEFCKIMQHNGHYAVHSHLGSSISVPMESPCVSSYTCANLSPNLHSYGGLYYRSNFRRHGGVPLFNAVIETPTFKISKFGLNKL